MIKTTTHVVQSTTQGDTKNVIDVKQVVEIGRERHHRLGPKPVARDSIFEIPEHTPLSSGTVNFMAYCMVVVTLSTCLDNYQSKGYFVDYTLLFWLLNNLHLAVLLWFFMILLCYSMYFVTKFTVIERISFKFGLTLYVFAQSVIFAVPTWLLFHGDFSPMMRGATCMQLCVHAMKSHSFWATVWLTHKEKLSGARKNDEDIIQFPNNVNISNFTYFMLAPTLVYEFSFPRTPSFRIRHFLKYSSLVLLVLWIEYVILDAHVIPLWKQSMHANPILLTFKLSIPSVALWMLSFYAVFHCILNVVAEFTCFADREFYQDWWNATSFDMWWRKWNRPVYKWMFRHIYGDCLHVVSVKRSTATFITFLVSAILHEFVVSMALNMFWPVLSICMLLQIGLIYLTRHPFISGPFMGNLIMWSSVFLGQPAVEISYCSKYYSAIAGM